jgi:Mor family transcriptional regulator
MSDSNRYHAEFFETFEEIRQVVGDDHTKKILEIITMRHGGQQIRVPDPHDLWLEERDRQICDKFNGVNHQELAILYVLSPTQIRRIVVGKRR